VSTLLETNTIDIYENVFLLQVKSAETIIYIDWPYGWLWGTVTLSITAFGIMTLRITAFSIMVLSITVNKT
jgi:hypothetical protein